MSRLFLLIDKNNYMITFLQQQIPLEIVKVQSEEASGTLQITLT